MRRKTNGRSQFTKFEIKSDRKKFDEGMFN
jgi:hypothetical protein